MAFGSILYNTDLWLETESLPYLHEYYKAKLANLPYILGAAERSSSAHTTPIRSNKHLPSLPFLHTHVPRALGLGIISRLWSAIWDRAPASFLLFFRLELYTPLPLNWGIREKTRRKLYREGRDNGKGWVIGKSGFAHIRWGRNEFTQRHRCPRFCLLWDCKSVSCLTCAGGLSCTPGRKGTSAGRGGWEEEAAQPTSHLGGAQGHLVPQRGKSSLEHLAVLYNKEHSAALQPLLISLSHSQLPHWGKLI